MNRAKAVAGLAAERTSLVRSIVAVLVVRRRGDDA